MKKWEMAALAGFLFCILLSFCGFSRRCDSVRGEVMRLHILANSDSEDDQNLKLAVRDEILKESEFLFAQAENLTQAKALAEENIMLFENAANKVLAKNGSSQRAAVYIGKSEFNTRFYGDITMPAGVYDSLIIKIGKAQGKNWWCVMFPQMCLPAADDRAALGEALSDKQVELLESGEKYRVKFKCVEWYEGIRCSLGLR
ncbi:MAG: stage II sporulation protein R [Clostridia bacterium]|nr:stage II sporulation protein R [Clostridia bacterium]